MTTTDSTAAGIAPLIHFVDQPEDLVAKFPKPSVGRIVHYQSYGTPGGEYLPEPRAAIITQVHPPLKPVFKEAGPAVGLAILNPTGMFFNETVPFAEKPTPGSWNWPPRV